MAIQGYLARAHKDMYCKETNKPRTNIEAEMQIHVTLFPPITRLDPQN